MSGRVRVVLAGLSCLASAAVAQNHIREWGGGSGIAYEINQANETVVITAPGAYKFQATDPNRPQGLGHIESITVDPNMAGAISLWILRDPNDVQDPNDPNQLWGAADVDLVNLPRNTQRAIVELRVLNTLAADGDVIADIVGVDPEQPEGIFVGGDILNDIHIAHLRRNLTCRSMQDLTTDLEVDPNYPTGDIWVRCGENCSYNGTISVRNSVLSIQIGDDYGGDFGGVVDVSGDLLYLGIVGERDGLIDVGRDLWMLYSPGAGEGTVRVGHDLGGLVSTSPHGDYVIGHWACCNLGCYFDGGFLGRMEFAGDAFLGYLRANFVLGGDIIVHGDLSGEIEINEWAPWGDFTGRIIVDGDWLGGWMQVPGEFFDSDGDLGGGHIIIKGSFGGPSEGPWIWVRDWFHGSTEFICVDYDGWDADDSWNTGCVQFGDPEEDPCYEENTPGLHLWRVSGCKGDLDGDGTVGFPDINPFILAITDRVWYSQYFPGLGCTNDPNDPDCLAGSRIWHGDLTCDDPPHLGFEDINPFVALMTNPCCQATCDPCPGGDGMRAMLYGDDEGQSGQLSPEALAAELAANVWPELYGDLVDVVATAIEVQPDDESRAYWEAVYAALTE